MLTGAALVDICTDGAVWAFGGPRNRLPARAAAALVAAHDVEAVGGVVAGIVPQGTFVHICAQIRVLRVELQAGRARAGVAAQGVDADTAAFTDSGFLLTFVHILTRVLTLVSERCCPRNEPISWATCAVVAPIHVLAIREFSTGHRQGWSTLVDVVTTVCRAGDDLPRPGAESRMAATGGGIDTYGVPRAPGSTAWRGRGCGGRGPLPASSFRQNQQDTQHVWDEKAAAAGASHGGPRGGTQDRAGVRLPRWAAPRGPGLYRWGAERL